MSSTSEKPFIIMIEQRDREPNGHFQPGASLKVTSALRTSGLLHALPPEEAAWLLFLLTFCTPNGDCHAYLEPLSEAMQVSRQKAEKRMGRLADFRWQGEALVLATRHESGLVSYALSPRFVSYEQEEPEPPQNMPGVGGFRDAIIARSRELYTRPRAEVERMIEAQYGRAQPASITEPGIATAGVAETSPAQELQRRLENAGITSDQAGYLISAYPVERIEQQLAWLPYRNARNPAGFLIAAIENDYDEPLPLRFEGIDGGGENESIAEVTGTEIFDDTVNG